MLPALVVVWLSLIVPAMLPLVLVAGFLVGSL